MADQARLKRRWGGIGLLWRGLILVWLLGAAGICLHPQKAISAQELLSIGQIQGQGSESGFLDRAVRLRGVVTGILEDENARGTRFYTVFVQDVPGSEDGDPLTSDGLAIFVGARRPAVAVGDIAIISGYVTEFYGLTELDNNGLSLWIESRNNELPEPIVVDPPADNALAASYLERFEGMRVTVPAGIVVGPAHVGCGFSLVRQEHGIDRVLVRTASDPMGQVLGVLHPSDVNCETMPAVATGDAIGNLNGPLTYHFERFKIVYQDAAVLVHQPIEQTAPPGPPQGQTDRLVIATFNVNNYFDGIDDTGSDSEPKPSPAELSLKQTKVAATISEGLHCPDLLGLQEVENEALLMDLAAAMADGCGFVYQVTHLDGPDERGADVALLSNPTRAAVLGVEIRQTCTALETDISDPDLDCPPDQAPLHGRPPLQVELLADGQPLFVLVNHFKSKRGGAEETAAWRLAQAAHLRQVVEELGSSRPEAGVVVLGDFNDYDGSEVMQVLGGQEVLVDALQPIPADTRYSTIFDGASQLIDWILVSPSLADRVIAAGILHSNADYPVQLGHSADGKTMALRSSDHDVPYIVINSGTAPEATATPRPTTIRPGPEMAPTREVGEGDVTRSAAAGEPDSGSTVDENGATVSVAEVEADAKPQPVPADPEPTQPPQSEPTVRPARTMVRWALVGLLALVGGAILLAAAIKRRQR